MFLYGDFINAVGAFVITAAIIYYLVVLPMNQINDWRSQNGGRANHEAMPSMPERSPARGATLCLLHRPGQVRPATFE